MKNQMDPYGVQERALIMGLWGASSIAKKLGWNKSDMLKAIAVVWKHATGEDIEVEELTIKVSVRSAS